MSNAKQRKSRLKSSRYKVTQVPLANVLFVNLGLFYLSISTTPIIQGTLLFREPLKGPPR